VTLDDEVYDDNGGDFYDESARDDLYDDDDRSPAEWQYDDYYEELDGRPKRSDGDSDAAEREAVRELLAERAAEEARQALLAYLTAGEPTYRVDEPQYLVDPTAEELALEDEDYEELMNGGDGNDEEEYDEEPELTEKRFYPYSYEPYDGRWGALVPGAKRGDRDPYDRLYRLAEVLSRPARLESDVEGDYEKK